MQNCSKLFLLKSSNPKISRTPIEFPCEKKNENFLLLAVWNLAYTHYYRYEVKHTVPCKQFNWSWETNEIEKKVWKIVQQAKFALKNISHCKL